MVNYLVTHEPQFINPQAKKQKRSWSWEGKLKCFGASILHKVVVSWAWDRSAGGHMMSLDLSYDGEAACAVRVAPFGIRIDPVTVYDFRGPGDVMVSVHRSLAAIVFDMLVDHSWISRDHPYYLRWAKIVWAMMTVRAGEVDSNYYCHQLSDDSWSETKSEFELSMDARVAGLKARAFQALREATIGARFRRRDLVAKLISMGEDPDEPQERTQLRMCTDCVFTDWKRISKEIDADVTWSWTGRLDNFRVATSWTPLMLSIELSDNTGAMCFIKAGHFGVVVEVKDKPLEASLYRSLASILLDSLVHPHHSWITDDHPVYMKWASCVL